MDVSLESWSRDLLGGGAAVANRSLWQRRSVQLAIIWAVWTLIGVLFSIQVYFATIYSERPVAWSRSLFSQLLDTSLMALVTPLIFWLARRYPVEQSNWLRHVFIHIAAATLLIMFISSAYHIIYYQALISEIKSPYSPFKTIQFIVFNFSSNLTVYCLIVLISHAYSYYKRYREGELKASQLETRLTLAQLQALKMQLHPHFLFNTLHSISALVHKDAEAADKMIARLGDFLRLTLENSGTQEVTLQQELEFLQCYLEIERLRFPDRLTTHIKIGPQTLDAAVPNLILQPIVENAIKYGIAPRSAPGRIEITAERKHSSVRIQVRDNGPGLSVNPSADYPFKDGLGLANTRARLKQLYGTAHRFELVNDPAGGLIVTLEIPSAIETLQPAAL